MPTVIFAILLALALLKLGSRAQPVIEFCAIISDAMIVIVDVLLKFTPIGVFALMASTIADSGFGVLISLIWYCFAVILGLTLQVLVVYPALLMVVAKVSPKTFFGGMKSGNNVLTVVTFEPTGTANVQRLAGQQFVQELDAQGLR